MYKVVTNTPNTWDSESRGAPLITLADEYGGQSVIGIDDHCLVLYNGSEDREFKPVQHWYKEAVLVLSEVLKNNPGFVEEWLTN